MTTDASISAPASAPEESNVCVAVKIRPLSTAELDDGCRESLYVTPGLPQITTGQHTFTYDHVFGEGGTMPDMLYPRCIAPLVDGLFKGYNATVFAYGQTGSGKTFTMGSEYKPGGRCRGVIPDAINDIFKRIEAAKDAAITVRVSFVEIHKEEIKDLLLPSASGPRPAVTIRETQNGVALYGAVEKEVRSREEMAEVLEMGTLCRSTASTSMNNRSSRSHAIFSITIEQRRQVQQPSASTPTAETASVQGGDDEGEEEEDAAGDEMEGVEDFLGAKLHLVDLAGSERAKRTKAEGARLREGIHINRGLLALGNVINAIVDNHKHVPYRDSKLTRLLQDSLGGNSRTVMIACVSPADSNFEESLNTLRYADRARHIKNKPTVNRDPVAAQIAVLRNTIAQLRSENVSLRRALASSGTEGALGDVFGGGSASERLGVGALESVVERLTQENSSLESDNMRLKMEMDDLRSELARVTDKWHTAQAQCDLLRMNQAAAAAGLARGQGDAGAQDAQAAAGAMPQMPGVDIVKGYLERISELEAEVKSMKSLAHLSFARRRANGCDARTPGEPGTPQVPGGALQGINVCDVDADFDTSLDQQPELAAEEESFMAELAAHTLNQEKMKKEVALLQRRLEEKERKMAELMKGSAMPHLKQQYDRALTDLEKERDKLLADRKALAEKLAALSAANEEEHKRLESQFRERIRDYDLQLKQLRVQSREITKMQKLKERTEAVQRQLSAEIQRLKQNKVALQRQMEASAKQFAAWRQEREKELAQLRKQSRRDRATIQQLEAMQAKQNAFLQRKISEGNAARKRLKEYQEMMSKRAAFISSAASQQQIAAAAAQQQALGGNLEIQPNLQAPTLRTDKDRRDWLQKELDLCNMSSEFRKIIDGELAQRAEASRKLKELEKRLTVLDQLQPASPLLAGGVVQDLALSPGTAAAVAAGGLPLGPEGREKLIQKRKELEDRVAYHNSQITELQAQWERQKAEEESRGGGAMDPRRWAGLKNVVESRELLRTLFRLSVEAKTLCNDLTVDMVRYSEEVDVLRVQLEGAQQKVQQYRKYALAVQAAAGAGLAVQHHSSVTAQDDTDKQVDAVLEELHVVRRNTPSTTAGARSGARRESPVPVARNVNPAPTAGNEDIEMEDVGTPGTPSGSQDGHAMKPKALEFLSPVPSRGRPRAVHDSGSTPAQRYSPDHDDDSEEEDSEGDDTTTPRGKRVVDENAMDVDEEDESADEDESDESDSDDDDWDPSNPTPARGRGGRGNRRASSLAAPGLSADAGGGSSRRNSRRHSAVGGDGDHGDRVANASGSRGQGASRRTSSRPSTSPDDAALEGPILDHINIKRYSEGHQVRLTKLTVAVLKDALKGQIIDGQRWHAGSKNRAALIQDYCRLMGLDKAMPSERQPAEPSGHGGTEDMSLLHYSRAASGKSSGGCSESSFTGSRPRTLEPPASPLAPPAGPSEGFTFSPHHAAAPPGIPPLPLQGITGPSPARTPSARRTGAAGNALGPWARSSLNAQTQSARPYTTWASSLRSSCTILSNTAADGGAGASGGALLRTGSGSGHSLAESGSMSSRKLASGGASARYEPVALNTVTAVQTSGSGALRESLDYRGAVLAAPQQSPSPRISRQPVQTATGATSPRSSLGTPSPQLACQRSGAKSPASGGWSPGGSLRERAAQGGENMQPGCTPRATTGGSTPGSGKGTPMTNNYKEKAAAARERTAALRISLQKNWDKNLEYEPLQRSQNAGAQPGGATARSLTSLAPGGATGTVASSMEVARGGAGLRDSANGALGAAAQKQKAIWR